MKKIFGLFLTLISFLSTQSFANSINVGELQKKTNPSVVAKNGTMSCLSSANNQNKK